MLKTVLTFAIILSATNAFAAERYICATGEDAFRTIEVLIDGAKITGGRFATSSGWVPFDRSEQYDQVRVFLNNGRLTIRHYEGHDIDSIELPLAVGKSIATRYTFIDCAGESNSRVLAECTREVDERPLP